MSGRRLNRPNNKEEIENNLTKAGFNQLSEVRRGEITDAFTKKAVEKEQASIVGTIAHSPKFRKTATVGAPTLPSSNYSVERMGPDVYSPLFQLSNLNLPRDRVTMNAWNRIFYDLNPIVRNAINLHASYPISKINIMCEDKNIENFFLEMAEKIDLYSVVYGVALEYFKLGEAIPYAELDKNSGTWKRITILNPDYVHIEKEPIGENTIVSLRPDARLQKIVTSNNPKDIALRKKIPQHILNYIKKGMNIPLDNLNVSHLKLLSSPYDVRGTSIIVSIYKDLMHWDKIREAKFAQADGMINPLTLVKVGSAEHKADASQLEAFKAILEEAQYDKDFKLVTHDAVTIERVGFSGATLDTAADMEFIVNNIYAGLMVPRALVEQESSCLKVSDNEVLTERGWLHFDDITPEDKIATLNQETNTLEYHKPNSRHEYNFSGLMYSFKNHDVDIEVTDFHEMLIARDKKFKFEKVRALNVFDINDINSNTVFDSKYKKNVRFLTSIENWTGESGPEYIEVPFTERYTNKQSVIKIPLNDWLEFLGYYLSEGHLRRRPKSENFKPASIEITQQPYSKGFKKMTELFDRFPYKYIKTGERHNRHSWVICNKNLADFVLAECGERSEGKFIPSWIKKLNKDKLDIVLDALILGDGSFIKSGSSGSVAYHTVSKRLADDIQEIAFKCGYSVRMKTVVEREEHHKVGYKLTIIKNENTKKGKNRKFKPMVKPNHTSINYVINERVFCFDVPNHIFVTRHNGKIGIHGNSYASSSIGLEVLRQRYDIFRNMMKKWLEQKVFAPICEMQGFFVYEGGEQRLVVPRVEFNHMNLWDMNDYIQNLSTFVTADKISMQTLCRPLGISYEEEAKRLKEESIHKVIRAKEEMSMQKMRLSELRNLDADSVIPDLTDEEQEMAMPEEEALPGMGGGDLGLPPPPMGMGDAGMGGGEMPPPVPPPEPPK